MYSHCNGRHDLLLTSAVTCHIRQHQARNRFSPHCLSALRGLCPRYTGTFTTVTTILTDTISEVKSLHAQLSWVLKRCKCMCTHSFDCIATECCPGVQHGNCGLD
ncbi:unnamed protein product [Ixodes pacificus]